MVKFLKCIMDCLKSILTPRSPNGTKEVKPVSEIVTSYKNVKEVDTDIKRRKQALNKLMKMDKIEVKEYKPRQHSNVMKMGM